MKNVIVLLVMAVVALAGCKGGDSPSDTSSDRKIRTSLPSAKGSAGYNRAALDYALSSVEKMAAQVKALPKETREQIVKQTVESLRKNGRYQEDDLSYFEKKLRVVYGL